MQTKTTVYLLLMLTLFNASLSVKKRNYFEVYKQGTDAYLENGWSDCIAYISSSVDFYFEMQASAAMCRKSCRPKSPEKLTFEFSDETDNIAFYDQLVKEALCVAKCKYDKMSAYPEPKEVPTDVEEEFEKRLPYDYLQLCYYKVGFVCPPLHIHHPYSEYVKNNLSDG